MTISLNTNVASNTGVRTNLNTKSVNFLAKTEEIDDVVDVSKPTEKKEKTSLWQRFKNGYTNFRKGLNRVGEYIVGTAKGLVYGGVTALAVLGADAIRGIVKKAPKAISTKGKIFAGLAGAAVLIGNVFNANLKANEKNAGLDHRWQTGHNK